MTDKRPSAEKSFRKTPQTSKRKTLRKNVGKVINKEKKEVEEWTLEGFLDEIKKINNTMEDRSFAFILGAGASVSSGIPAGGFFAEKWMNELYQRQCLDKNIPLETWVKDKIHPELDTKNPAVHYPKIFEKRFKGDWQSGYVSLEDAMEEAQPGLGYSLLAQILDQTRHKVIVTTNFDNLVANALAIHANKQPLVVGHEGLSGFVRPNRKRPLIAKIHRDLYFAPKNDSHGVDTLEQGWHEALQRLFSHYTPIVIGYGGNDGSLMNFLNNEHLQIPGRIFWCYRGEDRPTNSRILETVARHNGIFVSINDFDELMLQLSTVLIEKFNFQSFINNVATIGKFRSEKHQLNAEEKLIDIAIKTKQNPTSKNQKSWENISNILHNEKSQLSWHLKALVEKDFEKSKYFFEKAIEIPPKNADLLGNYANLLKLEENHWSKAEDQYKEALEINPNHATNHGNYANFLWNQKKHKMKADSHYKKALHLAPENRLIADNKIKFLVSLCYEKLKEKNKHLKIEISNTVDEIIALSNNSVSSSLTEAIYYRALNEEIMKNPTEKSLSQLKFCLQEKYPQNEWDFSELISVISPKIKKENIEMYRILGLIIGSKENKQSELENLKKEKKWIHLTAISPFETT